MNTQLVQTVQTTSESIVLAPYRIKLVTQFDLVLSTRLVAKRLTPHSNRLSQDSFDVVMTPNLADKICKGWQYRDHQTD